MAKLQSQSVRKLEKKAKIRKTILSDKSENLTDECEWHSDNCLYCKDKNDKWILVDCLEGK